MPLTTIEWADHSIKIIDQTGLPSKLKYLYLRDLKSVWRAIRSLQVRGAPALGAAAALGVYLAIDRSRAENTDLLKKEVHSAAEYLATARPTARNLFGGLERMLKAASDYKGSSVAFLKTRLFSEAKRVINEDKIACRKIGDYGARILNKDDIVLTVCNAGILATIDYGTALGVIYKAYEKGKKVKVYACETRPLFQGARLTCWELKKKNVDVTLICDNMAAILMQQGMITRVIAGADRIAANGDTANKVGTYNLAVLCRHHKIPFYVAAPKSTFDLSIKDGSKILIEKRDPFEVTGMFFKHPVSVRDIKVFNPAFDITPGALITAIITERGIVYPPYKKNIPKVLAENIG
jgi:methylthioribose-1-phosphate isomerase